MEEKDFNALLEKINIEVKKGMGIMLDDQLKDLLKSAELAAKVKELGLDPETFKLIEAAVTKQGNEINELRSSKPAEKQSLRQFIEKQMPKLKESRENKSKMFFDVPMVYKTVTVNSSITSDGGGYMIPGFEDYPQPLIGLQAAFTLISLPADHHGIIRFTYQSTDTKNGAFTAEGSAPTADVHAWTSSYVTVEKVMAIEKVSYESLTDVVDMQSTMQRLLSNTIWQKRETDLYSGNGAAPHIYGLYTNATAFTYANWAGITTVNPNLYDLAMLLKSEISRLYGGKFLANCVCVNPSDLLNAQWNKDELGQYILNPFASPDGMNIGGMKVVVSPAITAGTMMVGDSRFAYLYLGDNIEIEVGYEGTDFKDDLVTLKARHRLAVKMSPNDCLGWYKIDVIKDALTAIAIQNS
jgi:HK97 family phage major capsid protein